jgi:hypothetical protein
VDDLLLLGMWTSVRRHSFGSVRSLHACDCAHTTGAGRVNNAWHRPVVIAMWVERRRIWVHEDTVVRRSVRGCGDGDETRSDCGFIPSRTDRACGRRRLGCSGIVPFTWMQLLSLSSIRSSRKRGGRSDLALASSQCHSTRTSTSVDPPTTFTSSHHPHSRPETLHSQNNNLTMPIKPISGVCAAIEGPGQWPDVG